MEGSEQGLSVVGTHPKHPPCPICGKALYKALEKGSVVKKTDPWAWCRNASCAAFGASQAAPDGVQAARAGKERKAPAKRALSRMAKSEVVVAPVLVGSYVGPVTTSASPDVEKISTNEPPVIVKARARIHNLIHEFSSAKGGNLRETYTAVGIVLAIASQELGNHKAANSLIEQYKLDTILGIMPQESRASV